MSVEADQLRGSVVVGYVPTRMGHLAIGAAIEEAGWRGVGVVVLNVVGSRGHTTPTAADEKDLDALQDRLRDSGVEHEVRHVDGEPAQAAEVIVEVADGIGAGLIVIGIHRRSRVGKMLLGSNAQRVLLEASCPVLAVREPS